MKLLLIWIRSVWYCQAINMWRLHTLSHCLKIYHVSKSKSKEVQQGYLESIYILEWFLSLISVTKSMDRLRSKLLMSSFIQDIIRYLGRQIWEAGCQLRNSWACSFIFFCLEVLTHLKTADNVCATHFKCIQNASSGWIPPSSREGCIESRAQYKLSWPLHDQ